MTSNTGTVVRKSVGILPVTPQLPTNCKNNEFMLHNFKYLKHLNCIINTHVSMYMNLILEIHAVI